MGNATQTNLGFAWAETGAITDPDGVDPLRTNYKEGWLSEIPTNQEFNYVLNAMDNNTLYLAEHGRFEYDAAISYDEGASVHVGARTYYSVTDNNVGNAVGNKSYWVEGYSYGDVGMSSYTNSQGLLLSNIGTYASNTLWEGNDLTVKSALPIIAFESTNATDNWLLGNIEGEMCVSNKATTTLPDNSSVAKSQATTYRLFHEGHTPTQAEVSGTIPDAPSNSNQYARKGGNWEVVSAGISDAPSDGNQYARKDAGWEQVTSASIQAGDLRTSALSDAIMLSRGYLPADGTADSRTTEATLFAAIGTDFGDGDGSTTFNRPNIPNVVEASNILVANYTEDASWAGLKAANPNLRAYYSSGDSYNGGSGLANATVLFTEFKVFVQVGGAGAWIDTGFSYPAGQVGLALDCGISSDGVEYWGVWSDGPYRRTASTGTVQDGGSNGVWTEYTEVTGANPALDIRHRSSTVYVGTSNGIWAKFPGLSSFTNVSATPADAINWIDIYANARNDKIYFSSYTNRIYEALFTTGSLTLTEIPGYPSNDLDKIAVDADNDVGYAIDTVDKVIYSWTLSTGVWRSGSIALPAGITTVQGFAVTYNGALQVADTSAGIFQSDSTTESGAIKWFIYKD